MTVRAFIVLLLVTVIAIAIGDHYAQEWTAPGLERSFAVLVIASVIVAPAAWLLGRIGWISGRLDLSRRRSDRPSSNDGHRNGGAA
jgi:hypothetical protein